MTLKAVHYQYFWEAFFLDNANNSTNSVKKDLKFCQHCGAKIDAKAVVCPKCGVPVSDASSNLTHSSNNEPKPSAWWGVLGFLFPIIGWILYFVFKKDTPKRAHRCAVWAWIGFAVGVVVWMIFIISASVYY